MYNNTITLILGLATLIVMGWGIYNIYKKYKDAGMDIGETLAMLAVDKSETIFILGIILLSISEGYTAASVHPEGEQSAPFSTIMSHIAMIIIGATAAITVVRDFATLFVKGLEWKYKAWQSVVLLITLTMAILIPVATVFMVAGGLGADLEFQLWLYDINPFVSDRAFNAELYNLKYPLTYKPWANLPILLKRSIFITCVHVLAMVYEGARNLASPRRSKMLMDKVQREISYIEKEDKKEKKKEQAKENVNDTPMAGERRKLVRENLEYLLRFIKYNEGKIKNIAQQGMTTVENFQDKAAKAAMAVKIGSLRNNVENLVERDDKGSDTYKNDKAQLKEDIRKLFTNDKDAANEEDRGLGMRLAKSGN